MSTNFLEAVRAERERQLAQGKAEDNPHSLWYVVVADQLAMITRTFSLTRYRGVRTASTEPELTVHEIGGLQLGLIRLAACAMAWYEALNRERTT
jgi:hypothetical protein